MGREEGRRGGKKGVRDGEGGRKEGVYGHNVLISSVLGSRAGRAQLGRVEG